MAKLRAAIITDIHYGPDSGAKLGTKAPRLMEKFTKAASAYNPDAVVDIGDRITAYSHEEAKTSMRAVKDYFNRLAAPVYSVLGNHDVRHLSRHDNEAITGCPSLSYSVDVGDYHFVFLNPDVDPDKREGLHAAAEELAWLKADLAATAKPTVIFSHVPLCNDKTDDARAAALRGGPANPFFYPQGADIRAILEDSGKVILCMAGHLHRHRHREINGIHYVIQDSLTQTWRKKYRIPTGTFSFLELDDDKITIKIQGKAPKTLELAPRLIS